ncbi:MAG: sugar phosphate nucleotidyltransferase, partial [Phycisphaeraceae bacterium]|nr:sugar phosphate nucleotidyltransferase [Phycisphaeraceae bacterium]
MKGVVLAGGLGTRLKPLTDVTNKHLLPVYHEPMVYHPLRTLVDAGIDEILLVTGGEYAGDFLKVLQNGQTLGIGHLEYAYQAGHGGIADALKLAEDFSDGDAICVMLGDNILEQSIADAADAFREQASGARLLLKEVDDPERFGVAALEGDRITRIIEKPADPPSNLAVTGVYFYDADVFEICQNLKPSDRGELEITDVNNAYLQRGDLTFSRIKGWWTDAGTFDSLLRANQLVAERV